MRCWSNILTRRLGFKGSLLWRSSSFTGSAAWAAFSTALWFVDVQHVFSFFSADEWNEGDRSSGHAKLPGCSTPLVFYRDMLYLLLDQVISPPRCNFSLPSPPGSSRLSSAMHFTPRLCVGSGFACWCYPALRNTLLQQMSATFGIQQLRWM